MVLVLSEFDPASFVASADVPKSKTTNTVDSVEASAQIAYSSPGKKITPESGTIATTPLLRTAGKPPFNSRRSIRPGPPDGSDVSFIRMPTLSKSAGAVAMEIAISKTPGLGIHTDH